MSWAAKDPNMVEIERGFVVGQCETLEQCDYAIAFLDEAIDRITEQVAPYAGRSHTVIEDDAIRDWLIGARMALKHKQRGKAALVGRRAGLVREFKADRAQRRERAILDVIKDSLPSERMAEYLRVAKERNPGLWQDQEATNG